MNIGVFANVVSLVNKHPVVDYSIIKLLIQVIFRPEQRRFISRIIQLVLKNVFSFSLRFDVSKIANISVLIKKPIDILQTLGHRIFNQLISFLLLGYFAL